MRMHNLHETDKEKDENESSDGESDEDEEDEDRKPQLELAMMPHYGGINRVRVSQVAFLYNLLLYKHSIQRNVIFQYALF